MPPELGAERPCLGCVNRHDLEVLPVHRQSQAKGKHVLMCPNCGYYEYPNETYQGACSAWYRANQPGEPFYWEAWQRNHAAQRAAAQARREARAADANRNAL